MPISVECSGCGKRLNVKDEYVGRRIKCPKCGETFLAAAGAPSAPPPRPVGVLKSASPRAGKSDGKGIAAKIHVSPGIIVLVALAIILPTTFFLYRVGPGHVQDTLAKLDESTKLEITDVVDRVIQSYLSHEGSYNPLKSHNIPHTLEVTLLPSPMYMTMPESIGFVGKSTEGAFHGQYHFKTHEIEAEVEVGGMSLPSGVLVRHGNTVLHSTGRNIDGKFTAEIDGKNADIRQPPKED